MIWRRLSPSLLALVAPVTFGAIPLASPARAAEGTSDPTANAALPAATAPVDSDTTPLTIEADSQSGNPKDQTYSATGNVKAVSGDQEIQAQAVQGNWGTGAVAAQGHVHLAAQGKTADADAAQGNLKDKKYALNGNVLFTTIFEVPVKKRKIGPRAVPVVLRADHLDYDFKNRSGSMQAVEVTTQGLRFRGQTGVIRPDQSMLLQGAEFSACLTDDEGRYGYFLRAKTVDVSPTGESVAHRVSLYIGHRRIVSMSQVHLHRTGEGTRAHLPTPTFGRTALSGFFASYGFQPQWFKGTTTELRMDVTSEIGLRPNLVIRAEKGGPNPFFRLHLKEEATGRDRKRLLVDHLPEVGFRLDGDSNSRWNRWAQGELSYGYMVQHGPKVRGGRLQLTLYGQPISLKQWGPWSLETRPGIYLATYYTGDSYRDLNDEVSVNRRWTSRRNARVGLARHWTQGRSPFIFDQAALLKEFFGEIRWNFGSWDFGTRARFDLDSGQLFDASVSVGHIIHCIEPRLVYNYRTEQIRIEVNLVGLANLDDLPAANTISPSSLTPLSGDQACETCGDSRGSGSGTGMARR